MGSFCQICGVKPAFMPELYRHFTRGVSRSHDAAEAVVDKWVKLSLDILKILISFVTCDTTIKADQSNTKFLGRVPEVPKQMC